MFTRVSSQVLVCSETKQSSAPMIAVCPASGNFLKISAVLYMITPQWERLALGPCATFCIRCVVFINKLVTSPRYAEQDHGNLEYRKIILTELGLQVGTESFVGGRKFVKSRGKRVEERIRSFDVYRCQGKRFVKRVILFDRR